MENEMHVPRWYAIYTKPREEDRVDMNLTAWGVETFLPKIKQKRVNQFTGKPVFHSRSLFPRYIFARFDADRMLHKIYYTRGVQSVVSCNQMPLAVEDDIIALIRAQVDVDGFVRLGDELKPGDKVWVKHGAMRGINGIFDRSMKDNSRVMILLTAINYQASVIVERELVQKAGSAFCSV
jgi:transcriptional antiterminator RfaH